MALQSLGYGAELWWPNHPTHIGWPIDTSTYLIDASGELVEMIIRPPLAGTVDRFAALIAAVGNAPDNGLRFSFRDVSLSTGLQDTTVDQFATVASGSVATGWLDPGAFDASRTVTRSDYLALVVDFPSFVAADSVTVASHVSGNAGNFNLMPYGALNGTKQQFRIPKFALHYTDNGGFWVPLHSYDTLFHTAQTNLSIDTGTTPDEAGNCITLPFTAKLNKIAITLQATVAASDFDLIVYDSGGTALATLSHDGDVVSVSGATRWAEFSLASELTLSANTLYRVVVKPTSANNVLMVYDTLSSLLFSSFAGGNVYMTQRTDAGSWTDFNNGTDGYRVIQMQFGFSALDDGAGGAGGGGRRPRLSTGV